MSVRLVHFLGLIFCTASSLAQTTPRVQQLEQRFDPSRYRNESALPATRVMVLAVSHLDAAPKEFTPAWLAPVLCRVRAYAPDLILSEAMSGEQIMELDAFSAVHGDAGSYGGPTLVWAKETQAVLGVSGAEAQKQANGLAANPTLTSAQRRHLAALFMAAAEPYSSLVQWMRLPEAERTASDGLSDEMIARLKRIDGKRSELSSINARLAVDLGINRIYGAGDHSSDYVQGSWEEFKKAANADTVLMAQFNHTTPELLPISGEALKMSSPDKVLSTFRVLNSARFGELDANAQYISLLRSKTLGTHGRQILDAWEAQNLHMVTAVREATAMYPGKKALLVVGAAHKPFIEAYLRILSDVEVVSSSEMLDTDPAGCSR